jgi:predicted amidohydrolase
VIRHVALAQLACVEGDVRRNAASARRAVDEAAALGAEYVLLPELHLTGFVAPAELPRVAEPWPGAALSELAAHAAGHGLGVCTSFVEAAPDGGFLNTAVLTGRDGAVLGAYRKTHLFDAERSVFTAGAELLTPLEAGGVRTGVLVCYDLEFPEAARAAGLAGAECLLVPSANMEPWGARHRVFAVARALENHLFVAYCNRCGVGPGQRYVGGSCIVDPLGRLLCDAGEGEAVVCADLDTALIADSTRVFDYRLQRRPELYGEQ